MLPAEDVDGQNFAEQGYGKEDFGEWMFDGSIGARKYDDLTAIGIRLK